MSNFNALLKVLNKTESINNVINESLQKAKLYEMFKKLDEAESIYRNLTEKYPTDFRSKFNLARLLSIKPNGLVESCSLFENLLLVNPYLIETYQAYSGVLIKAKRPNDAVAFCTKGLQLNKFDIICLYNINIALRQVGKIHKAIRLSWNTLNHVQTNLTQNKVLFTVRSNIPVDLSSSITFICVKWGKKYGPEYVNNLYDSLSRNGLHHLPFNFVCYTDNRSGIHKEIQCLPFSECTNSWQGWWLKAQVFVPHPDINGWAIYLDLDTVICDSIVFLYDTVNIVRNKWLAATSTLSSLHTDLEHEISQLGKCMLVLNAKCFQNEGNL